ncbi:hypothetical protein ABZ252_20735 [Streptomyces sp. NPDC006175]|uniref:hypothetical protein n=1 Tax=unclassified Streptomyces TaxID=2593676 RepID=UPI0033B5228E
MRVIFGGTRGTIAGAALVALTLAGPAWAMSGPGGQTGGADREVRQLADSPLSDPCRDPINGWQGKPPVGCP